MTVRQYGSVPVRVAIDAAAGNLHHRCRVAPERERGSVEGDADPIVAERGAGHVRTQGSSSEVGMKRSFLSVLVAASFVSVVACGGDEANQDIEPVEDVMQPAPAPPPPPPTTTTDTMADTTAAGRDTVTTTTRE
jgi:hypothetical protein